MIKRWIPHIILVVLIIAVFVVNLTQTKPRLEYIADLRGYSRQLKNDAATTAGQLGALKSSAGSVSDQLYDEDRVKKDFPYIQAFFEKSLSWFSEKQADEIADDLSKHGKFADGHAADLLYSASGFYYGIPEAKKMSFNSTCKVDEVIPTGAANGVYSYEVNMTISLSYGEHVANADIMVFCSVDEAGNVSNISADLISMEEVK